MQPRELTAWPHKRRMLCAILTLYSASPSAHAAEPREPVLRLTTALASVPAELAVLVAWAVGSFLLALKLFRWQ